MGYDFSDPEWYVSGTDPSAYWIFYKNYIRVDITNPADPENNFEVYSYLDENGVPGSAVLIYKVGT